jgi:hypothetical protein
MIIKFCCNGNTENVEYADDTPNEVIQLDFEDWLEGSNDVIWYDCTDEEEE